MISESRRRDPVSAGSAVNLVVSADRRRCGAERGRPDAGGGDDGDHGCGSHGGHGDHGRPAARCRRERDQREPRRRDAGERGIAVNLVVSSGPAQVAVPNVVGLTQAAATTAITVRASCSAR